MKRTSVILLVFVLAAFVSMPMISPALAEIENFTWLPPYIKKGYDGYYAAYVVIYRHASTVQLTVPVKNHAYPNGLNVSKVIISFDWGQNKTLDLSANIKQVGSDETEIFTVSFTASATEAISSDWAHTYTIYVEHVNATTGPKKILDETWKVDWDDFPGPDYKFVVFSTDQADALDLSEEYDSYDSAYPSGYFTGVNASQLRGQAVIDASLGDMYYARGEYTSAETQYQTALDLFSQALAAEKEWATKVAEANLNVTLTIAEANMTYANAAKTRAEAAIIMANAVLNQSYAWILFGLGFVILSFAGLVYAIRKPKKPA